MYTEKELRSDLFEICQTYFVKYKLLENYVWNRIDLKTFTEELEDQKDELEIEDIINQVNEILQKIQQNGGRFAPDPTREASKLRKEGKLSEAYNLIGPYLQNNPHDKDAISSFGWVMYSFLKSTEKDIDLYCNNLSLFNQQATIDFNSNDKFVNMLKNSYLWSIRRVALVNEMYANRVFEHFMQLCGEKRNIFAKFRTVGNQADPARLLFNDFLRLLNTENYFIMIHFFGFNWFTSFDYAPSSFTNNEDERIEQRPFAERVLNFHAKKLNNAEKVYEEDIRYCLSVLVKEISKNPTYEWLPYYKIKLLIKTNQNKEALEELSVFVRKKSREFWIWDLLSEIVPAEEKFAYRCKGLLCKAMPEALVNLQEKSIPSLLKRELFSNAKFELDACIEIRNKKGWPISTQLINWRNEAWYVNAQSIKDRRNLNIYAKEAEKILYKTIPETDIFVTYMNEEKGVINFLFLNSSKMIREGYFYMDSIDENIDWQLNGTYKLIMDEDSMPGNLYRVYEAKIGDPTFVSNFRRSNNGILQKLDRNTFAFVNDVFISTSLVEKHQLTDVDYIEYTEKRSFNKKKNTWSWAVETIQSVSKV
ncbi:DUF7017 domain-containing protein [Sporosarcina sp. FSL K6-5500]|uniref:DUF7017 domain-containing protein n=1 Tax=Sporosarcina sp. FSL K6-5500 TaxID=2921558 RepID=UPI0030F9426C